MERYCVKFCSKYTCHSTVSPKHPDSPSSPKPFPTTINPSTPRTRRGGNKPKDFSPQQHSHTPAATHQTWHRWGRRYTSSNRFHIVNFKNLTYFNLCVPIVQPTRLQKVLYENLGSKFMYHVHVTDFDVGSEFARKN